MTVPPGLSTPSVQRLTASATSDASGNATFTFAAAPQGFVLSGTASIPGSPIIAVVNAYANGVLLGQWFGGNPWGPIEVLPGEVMSLQATGLTKSTNYTAVWIIQQQPLGLAPGASPAALLSSQLVAIQSFVEDLGTIVPGDSINLPNFTEAIVVQVPKNQILQFTGVGGTTGAQYVNDVLHTGVACGGPNIGGYPGPFYPVPVSGQIEASVTIVPASGSSATSCTVYAYSFVPPTCLPPPTNFTGQSTSGATVDIVGSGVNPTGPYLLKEASWTFISTGSSSTAHNAVLADSNGIGNILTPLIPPFSASQDGACIVGRSTFGGGLLLPTLPAGVAREITWTGQTNMDAQIDLFYYLLGLN